MPHVFKRQAIMCGTHKDSERGGWGGREWESSWRAVAQAGVLSKALPPERPPTHLPYLKRTDTVSAQLRAVCFCSSVCVGNCVCLCVCPSANSAPSFSLIHSDCPHTKLTSDISTTLPDLNPSCYNGFARRKKKKDMAENHTGISSMIQFAIRWPQ